MSKEEPILGYLNRATSGQANVLLENFAIGDRVELHPATDAWMMGDRFGTVEKIGRFYLHVKCDVSGKIRRVVPENIYGKV